MCFSARDELLKQCEWYITTFMTHHSQEITTSESEDSENEPIPTVSEVSDAASEDVTELRPSVS
jgi:hypothetical protein